MGLRHHWLPEMHYQNKAFGDVSLIVIVLILFVAAAARLFPALKKCLPWRKEMGIWAIVLSLIHVYIVFDGWIEWKFKELFGYILHQQTSRWVFADPGFALANIVGFLALFYGLALLITSNRLSVRLLTQTAWRHLHQRSAHFLYLLTAIHTAYFLYLYYFSFPKNPPPSNFFQTLFPVLIALLTVIQGAAFLKTVATARRQKEMP